MSRLRTFSTSQLLASKEYTDLTLVCDGRTFNVHKAIVCAQSPMLAAACKGPFQVRHRPCDGERVALTTSQESRTGTVAIEGFRPRTVRQLVEYLYKQEYTVDEELHEPGDRTHPSCSESSVPEFPPFARGWR